MGILQMKVWHSHSHHYPLTWIILLMFMTCLLPLALAIAILGIYLMLGNLGPVRKSLPLVSQGIVSVAMRAHLVETEMIDTVPAAFGHQLLSQTQASACLIGEAEVTCSCLNCKGSWGKENLTYRASLIGDGLCLSSRISTMFRCWAAKWMTKVH